MQASAISGHHPQWVTWVAVLCVVQPVSCGSLHVRAAPPPLPRKCKATNCCGPPLLTLRRLPVRQQHGLRRYGRHGGSSHGSCRCVGLASGHCRVWWHAAVWPHESCSQATLLLRATIKSAENHSSCSAHHMSWCSVQAAPRRALRRHALRPRLPRRVQAQGLQRRLQAAQVWVQAPQVWLQAAQVWQVWRQMEVTHRARHDAPTVCACNLTSHRHAT